MMVTAVCSMSGLSTLRVGAESGPHSPHVTCTIPSHAVVRPRVCSRHPLPSGSTRLSAFAISDAYSSTRHRCGPDPLSRLTPDSDVGERLAPQIGYRGVRGRVTHGHHEHRALVRGP